MPIHQRGFMEDILHNPIQRLAPFPEIMPGFGSLGLPLTMPLLHDGEYRPHQNWLPLEDLQLCLKGLSEIGLSKTNHHCTLNPKMFLQVK